MIIIYQTVSGKLKQATSVLLHLIGAAAVYASLLRESKKSTGDAGKVRMLSGVLYSDKITYLIRSLEESRG